MARAIYQGMQKQMDALTKHGKNTHGIVKMCIYDGADVLADAIRAEMDKHGWNHSEQTASLYSSLVVQKHRTDKNGTYTKVTFAGYDDKGVPNPLKAAVLEYGASNKTVKHPFIRPAYNKVKAQAVEAMQKQMDEQIKKLEKEF